ncbi:MAG: hypothetical protein ABSH10_02255 [Phycisphaerae bacterium]|jgi:hypothetical protein
MQGLLAILLLAVPVAAAIAFVVGGARQVRRRNRLARAAHEADLMFSVEDPFGVPRRYADFALISAGHGARATHVTYGRLGGLPIRAFDFRYEIGHGTRRHTRHYGVVVVEVESPLSPFLLWSRRDGEWAPLAVQQADSVSDGWSCRGEGVAWALAQLSGDLARLATGVEAVVPTACDVAEVRTALMVCAPVQRGELYVGRLEDVVALAKALVR